jgi:hypothetical protein
MSETKQTDTPEDMKKLELYHDIYDSKMFLKVYDRKNPNFNIQFPKSSYDRIIELYGKESTLPLSFVLFGNPMQVSETVRYSTRNVNIRTSLQIAGIFDFLDNFYIYPASYEGLGELEKAKIAPRLNTRILKNICDKMGIHFTNIINYITLQMTEIDIRETMRTVISVQTYQLVFNMLHLLNVKFPEKDIFEFPFYSYRKMLKMAGIELDKILPYLKVNKVFGQTRHNLIENENRKLLDKVDQRELKESIDPKIKDKNLDLYTGIESCEKIPKPTEFDLEPDREEASNLLNKLIEELEKK